MPLLYARDLGSAESQKHNEKLQLPEKLGLQALTCVAAQQDAHRSPAAGSGSPYSQHYQPTGEIWKLYLKETEAEDKELAQLRMKRDHWDRSSALNFWNTRVNGQPRLPKAGE
ncbi:hypothetical protein B0H14DRAFT_2611724 [Mycena olivaceomarginata]|nr:hypothetical protein B0H14DRAFT_2611724 [Mycena olivaceomarginata]